MSNFESTNSCLTSSSFFHKFRERTCEKKFVDDGCISGSALAVNSNYLGNETQFIQRKERLDRIRISSQTDRQTSLSIKRRTSSTDGVTLANKIIEKSYFFLVLSHWKLGGCGQPLQPPQHQRRQLSSHAREGR